jgi:hypothetical protein
MNRWDQVAEYATRGVIIAFLAGLSVWLLA